MKILLLLLLTVAHSYMFSSHKRQVSRWQFRHDVEFNPNNVTVSNCDPDLRELDFYALPNEDMLTFYNPKPIYSGDRLKVTISGQCQKTHYMTDLAFQLFHHGDELVFHKQW